MLESPSKMDVSSVLPMKLELPSNPVQELIKTAVEQVPERYRYQLSNKSVDKNDIEYMDSPIIDLSLLSASSSSQCDEELQKLRSVLSSWGCLQLINHGLPSSLLDQIREAGKEFFALPAEVKQCYRTSDWFEGYGCDTVSEGQSKNCNARLRLKVHPPSHRNFKLWPELLPNFRETLEEYTMEVRFNCYPPCSSLDQVLGFKPHSDGTAITILLQDELVEGLQVQKDDLWFKVPIVPDALFINIGDQLEIMSNGILRSVVHRVMVDKERERTSVVMICVPGPDKEVGPLSELIDEERPQSYKKIKNYFSVFFPITKSDVCINCSSYEFRITIKTSSKTNQIADRQVPEIYQLPNKSDDNQFEIEYIDSPVIDLSLLTALSSSQHEEQLFLVQSALSAWVAYSLLNMVYRVNYLIKSVKLGRNSLICKSIAEYWIHLNVMEMIQFLRVRVITGMIDCISRKTS
ncbi:hypothetical protein SOVF_206470 [Spinacia oleracea]|nr:hypothetical protein SOVF_206470 [Spinacia oleracea]